MMKSRLLATGMLAALSMGAAMGQATVAMQDFGRAIQPRRDPRRGRPGSGRKFLEQRMRARGYDMRGDPLPRAGDKLARKAMNGTVGIARLK